MSIEPSSFILPRLDPKQTTMETLGGYDRRVRRLSSIDATREQIIGGPSVLVPPKHLMASCDSYDTARSMGLARNAIDETLSSAEITPRTVYPGSKDPMTTADRYAFAFDIDGVLIRGGEPIPAAVEAMRILNGHNEYGIKV